MSTQQYLIDAATRHQVFLQRYGDGQSKEATALLYRIRRDINARLANEPTIFQKSRLEGLLAEINAITAAGFKDIELQQIAAAQELAIAEGRFSTALFNKAAIMDFKGVSSEVLIAATMTSGMASQTNASVTIEDALQQFGVKKSKQIAQVISDGVVMGDTTPVISQKVGQLINALQRRQLNTLVTTITNHTSSVARGQVYHANRDLLDGYQWVATLDNRTTFICGSRDGKVYQYGTGPMPPAHWNCRSTTIPVVKDEFNVGSKLKGTRPAIGADGVEQKSGRTTYGGWLKTQPKSFIDEALGPERSELFRNGGLTIDKFVDPTGRVYTLTQLQRMNPIAFQEF